MLSNDLGTVKYKCIYVVLFCEFASCQYKERHNDAKVLPYNLIASKPITNNYSNLRPPPIPYHSKIYNKTFIFFPSSFLLHPLSSRHSSASYLCLCVLGQHIIIYKYHYMSVTFIGRLMHSIV